MPGSLPPSDVFALAPGMLAVADRAGTLEIVNPAFAAAFDAEPSALAGRALPHLADAADREAVAKTLSEPHPAGTHRFGAHTLAWRATPGSVPDTLLIAAWDVTALRAEADGLAAELDALITSIGHDLRAPLRAVDGFAGVLLDDAHADALPDYTRRFLGLVRESSGELAARFDALLEVARLARDPLHIRDGVDVGALGREAIDYVLTPRATDRDIAWIVADDLPAARADPALVRRLLLALLDNALKFTGNQARIELAYDATHNAYVVRDDGPGFDPALTPTAMALFGRLQGTGAGAGLAIATRIAARHGGRLWVETAPGAGAAFFFTLAAPV